jgi:hypothetical protein
LFWALRGADVAPLGVATSFVFRPRSAASTTNFRLLWPEAKAVAVIDTWQHWAPAAPDELSASLLLAATTAEVAPSVEVFGAMLGSEADTAELLDGLVAHVGDPSSSFIEADADGRYRRARRPLRRWSSRRPRA